MSLDIESITSGYVKDVPILHDVTMKAEDGALTLIIGPNGAGKSTILRTVYGYLYPTGGEEAIELALRILRGEEVPKTIVLGTRIFTPENVGEGGQPIN